jgi:uncharacterized protein (TIGR03086 family)
MDSKRLFKEAVKVADSCISRVEPNQLGRATPCSEWDLRDLINHMVYEIAWVPDLLTGKTIKEIANKHEGDLLGDNFKSAWQLHIQAALLAVDKADIAAEVHLSYADVTADRYIREVGGDMLIHGWDVGQAINCSMVFDNNLAQAVYDFVTPRKEEFRASGLFGKPYPTEASDSLHVRLLAFFGRREEAWQSE